MSYPFTSSRHTVEWHDDLRCAVYDGLALSSQSFSIAEHYRARGWEILEPRAAEAMLLSSVREASAIISERNKQIEAHVREGDRRTQECERLAAHPAIGDERAIIERAIAAIANAHRAGQDEDERQVIATIALPRLASACRSPLLTKVVEAELAKVHAALQHRQALVGKLGTQLDRLNACLARLDDPATLAAVRKARRSIQVERLLPPEDVEQWIAWLERRRDEDDRLLAMLRGCRAVYATEAQP